MKKIMAISLVSLLGFLGCSGDDDGTTPPGQAIPVAPFGVIDTMTPTYAWTPVPGATRYLLMVELIGRGIEIEEWYTAEEGECSSEYGLCSVTPDINVIGDTWKVLACAGEECGLWSDELEFYLPIAGPPRPRVRFNDNGDGTVTDIYHNITWTKNADLCGTKNWDQAISYCESLEVADLSDWRLPNLSALTSLAEGDSAGTMPGHPFNNVAWVPYWSSSTCTTSTQRAWIVSFMNNFVETRQKHTAHNVWCIRGGN